MDPLLAAAGKGPVAHLCVGLNNVALNLVHGVGAVGNCPQVETLEHHLVLCQSPCRFETDVGVTGRRFSESNI